MRRATYHPEQIRRSTILPTFTQSLAEVHFHPHADFATLNVFTCERLNSVLTKEACAANYTRSNAPLFCKGCPIGSAHADGLNYRDESDRHAKAEAAHGLSCIRCERNVHTATKYIARFRLTRKHTLCMNCFNREREVVRGYNAKGAKPVKHSGLKTAAITVETAEGKRKIEDIGLRSGYLECARYVERVMPGATLLKTEFDGETIEQFSLWTPPPFSPWEPGMVRGEKPKKPTRTYIRRVSGRSSKPSSVIASPVDWDDWDTPLYAKPASDDHSDADGNGNARRCGWLPPMSEEDNAAYPASFKEGDALDPKSIAAHWDLTADGLPEFVEWLTDGWPAPGSEAACEHEDLAEEEIALEQLRMHDYREAKPSLSWLAKAHGISATHARYRLRTRGTVEFPLDPNGSVLHTHNTSGINGVSWVVKRNKWCARGYQAGRVVHLGYFDTIDDATTARASFDSEHTEPSTPVADAIALHEVAEHAVSDSEQTQQESEWAGCCLVRDGVTTYVCDYAREHGISDEAAAIELGMCDADYSDDPEPAAAPAPEPEPVKAEPAPKSLTGKQRRKLEKAQRRAERIQQRRPSAPKQIAVTARAYIEVMFEMGAQK